MPVNAVVRARIDEKTKKKATTVLKSMGLTPSIAFRLMMNRIATEKTLPFDFIPNAETAKALEAARRGELTTVSSFDELIEKLNEDD